MARTGRARPETIVRLEQLDETARARALDRVTEIELDGESILYDEATQELLVLNGSAGLIWQNLDGTWSLRELIEELAVAFGVDENDLATDVLDTVRQLGSHGFLAGVVAPPQFLADPPIGCRSCVDRLDELDWGSTITFLLGDLHIGVRSTDPDVDKLLRVALGAYVDDDTEAPVNFSLRIGGRERRGQAGLHVLYQASDQLARSTAPSDVVRALFAQLASYASGPADGWLRLRVPAVVFDGAAVLITPELAPVVLDVEPRLRRSGLQRIESPVVDIDAATRELVVSPPAIDLASGTATALTELDRLTATTRPRVPTAADGRYRLAAWITIDHDGPSAPNRAEELVELFDFVENLDSNARPATLEQIDRAFPMDRRVVVHSGTPAELADAIIDASRQPQ
ncbi:MAG: hypothetical protein QOF28_328 [Actinomycetota bacterium]|jgi:hypothetical protein|nr:hypothetical protein [Actinomycetota bacterium]